MKYPAITVIGKQNSGKTSLIAGLIQSTIPPILNPNPNTLFISHDSCGYKLFDTACISRIKTSPYQFWKTTQAVIIIVDCTSTTAMADIARSAQIVQTMSYRSTKKKFCTIPSILVINKVDDNDTRQLSNADAIAQARSLQISTVIEVSLHTYQNVHLVLKTMELLVFSSKFNPTLFYEPNQLPHIIVQLNQLTNMANIKNAVTTQCDFCFSPLAPSAMPFSNKVVCTNCKNLHAPELMTLYNTRL